MDDKNLHLSEKFSLLVIDTALRTQGPALLDRLSRQINEGTRGELARVQASIGAVHEDIARLTQTAQNVAESLQSATQRLQSLERRAGTDAESPAVHWKRVCDGIEKLNLGLQKESSARSKEIQELALSLRNVLESSRSGDAARGLPATGRPRGAWMMRERFRALARTAAVACALILVGGVGGALTVWKMQPSSTDGAPAIASKQDRNSFDAHAATKKDKADADSRGEQDGPVRSEELPPPASAATSSERLFDELIAAIKQRAAKDDFALLAQKLQTLGVDISSGYPDRGLSLGDLEQITEGADGKKIAALLLQALVLEKGEKVAADFKVDGKFGNDSLAALSRVECVASADDLQRDASSKQVIDPRKQVVEIFKACSSA